MTSELSTCWPDIHWTLFTSHTLDPFGLTYIGPFWPDTQPFWPDMYWAILAWYTLGPLCLICIGPFLAWYAALLVWYILGPFGLTCIGPFWPDIHGPFWPDMYWALLAWHTLGPFGLTCIWPSRPDIHWALLAWHLTVLHLIASFSHFSMTKISAEKESIPWYLCQSLDPPPPPSPQNIIFSLKKKSLTLQLCSDIHWIYLPQSTVCLPAIHCTFCPNILYPFTQPYIAPIFSDILYPFAMKYLVCFCLPWHTLYHFALTYFELFCFHIDCTFLLWHTLDHFALTYIGPFYQLSYPSPEHYLS